MFNVSYVTPPPPQMCVVGGGGHHPRPLPVTYSNAWLNVLPTNVLENCLA